MSWKDFGAGASPRGGKLMPELFLSLQFAPPAPQVVFLLWSSWAVLWARSRISVNALNSQQLIRAAALRVLLRCCYTGISCSPVPWSAWLSFETDLDFHILPSDLLLDSLFSGAHEILRNNLFWIKTEYVMSCLCHWKWRIFTRVRILF